MMIENLEDFVFKTTYWVSFFDKYPVSPGHTLIIPRRHVNGIENLNPEEWSELHEILKKVIEYVMNLSSEKKIEIYRRFYENPINEKSRWFAEQMLNSEFIYRKPDGYNVGVNIGEYAGQTIFHLHIHVIPRYKGDVEDPTGGVRNVIPKYGNYKKILGFQ